MTVAPWRVKPLIAASSSPACSSGDGRADEPGRVQPPGRDRVEQRRVVAHGHAVHAGQLQLVRDHAAHRHGDAALVASSRPTCTWRPRLRSDSTDAAQVAALPSASSATCAPPPVASTHGRRGVAGARVQGGLGAQLAREGELGGVDVDGGHARALRHGDHHRREADAAAAVHGDPVALRGRPCTATAA